jgi:uncharacterized membrane protein
MIAARRLSLIDLLTVSVLVVGVALTAIVYARLPDPMPTHFGVDGRPNGWMPRAVGAWIIPLVSVVVAGLARVGGSLMRGEWRERLEASPVRGLALASAVLLGSLQVLVLRAGLMPGHRLGGAVWVLLGLFFVAVGLLLPRTRRNPWFGVRTVWTLTSDENWARTHRVAGYSMTLGGLAAAVAGWFGSPAVALALVLTSALVPAMWSWRLGRHEDDGAHSSLR